MTIWAHSPRTAGFQTGCIADFQIGTALINLIVPDVRKASRLESPPLLSRIPAIETQVVAPWIFA